MPRLRALIAHLIAVDTWAGRLTAHILQVAFPVGGVLSVVVHFYPQMSTTADRVGLATGAVSGVAAASHFVGWLLTRARTRLPHPLPAAPTMKEHPPMPSLKTVLNAVVQGILHPVALATTSLIVLALGLANAIFVAHSVSAASIAAFVGGLAGFVVAVVVSELSKHPKIRALVSRAEKVAAEIKADAEKYDPEWKAQVDEFGSYALTHFTSLDAAVKHAQALAEEHGVSLQDVLNLFAQIGQSSTLKQVTAAASAAPAAVPPAAPAAA